MTKERIEKFLGSAAIDSMFKLLSGVQPPSKRLPGEIAARQSTAPPPNKAIL